MILQDVKNVRVTGHRHFLHDFSIKPARFPLIVIPVLTLTREHHSVIKMFCPDLNIGAFFSLSLIRFQKNL
ncbi:hypothetical protein ASU80_12210 [Enterobacter hormaechei subsp. xiangfangensis]|nr:hypothetical protein BET69_08860 [Enterobacter hormaechei]AWQ57294.1 hypothetical protein CAL61_08860 [Enterobacter hormaechei]KTI05086.1 hypothetical protein ASV11_09045 [Enterobacter hormaechei subsp. xiangfangensis]KTJ54182.1 hypothetical protein ASU80_12210 [Enterobacter hormaechei subsp. xiangfangensis]